MIAATLGKNYFYCLNEDEDFFDPHSFFGYISNNVCDNIIAESFVFVILCFKRGQCRNAIRTICKRNFVLPDRLKIRPRTRTGKKTIQRVEESSEINGQSGGTGKRKRDNVSMSLTGTIQISHLTALD